MDIKLTEIIVWAVVGVIAGTIAGVIVKRDKQGYGHTVNLIIGITGAAIGGFLFALLNIDLGLGKVSVQVDDLVSAVVGSFVFLGLVSFLQNRDDKKK